MYDSLSTDKKKLSTDKMEVVETRLLTAVSFLGSTCLKTVHAIE